MFNEERKITFLDVITKGDAFWTFFILGIFFTWLGLMFIWSIGRLLGGNDPDWTLISVETDNFIALLSVLISGYKNYNRCYDELNRERLEWIEKQKKWEEEYNQ